jgi:hypothetical protein
MKTQHEHRRLPARLSRGVFCVADQLERGRCPAPDDLGYARKALESDPSLTYEGLIDLAEKQLDPESLRLFVIGLRWVCSRFDLDFEDWMAINGE